MFGVLVFVAWIMLMLKRRKGLLGIGVVLLVVCFDIERRFEVL